MAWFKKEYNEDFIYSISSSDVRHVWRACKDLTEKELNDPLRDFTVTYHNPYFLRENIKIPFEKATALPTGVYLVEDADEDIPKLIPISTGELKDLFHFELNSNLIHSFTTFLNSREVYKELPPYKFGVLLWGPPGTGKSSAIKLLLQKYLPEDYIVLYLSSVPSSLLLKELEADTRIKILIFEELNTIVRYESSDEHNDLLKVLDGEITITNTFIISSTNYPDKLPQNLTNRPGRFDLLCEIEFLSDTDRKKYFSHYLKEVPEDLIEKTKKKSVAHLRAIILYILRDKLSYQEAITNVNAHEEISKARFKKIKSDKDLNRDIL